MERIHRWGRPLANLRAEARRRDGRPISPEEEVALENFKAMLFEQDLVVHYEPETEQGWWLVPRRHGIDFDLIREPGHEREA